MKLPVGGTDGRGELTFNKAGIWRCLTHKHAAVSNAAALFVSLLQARSNTCTDTPDAHSEHMDQHVQRPYFSSTLKALRTII